MLKPISSHGCWCAYAHADSRLLFSNCTTSVLLLWAWCPPTCIFMKALVGPCEKVIPNVTFFVCLSCHLEGARFQTRSCFLEIWCSFPTELSQSRDNQCTHDLNPQPHLNSSPVYNGRVVHCLPRGNITSTNFKQFMRDLCAAAPRHPISSRCWPHSCQHGLFSVPRPPP